MKVKSHIGIVGNEKADELAKEAAQAPGSCNRQVPTGSEGFQDMYWPTYQKSFGPDRAPQTWHCDDLNKDLKRLAAMKHQRGFTNVTIYTKAWSDIEGVADGDLSNKFWTDPGVSTSMTINTLKYRFGQLWNKKIAFRQCRPYFGGGNVARDSTCPLCHGPDSGGHILGGCEHAQMKALFIHRHDSAMRQVLNELNKGGHGSYYCIADVGTMETLGPLGVHDKRIPSWLLSNQYLAAQGIDPSMRGKMRPDIMLIQVTPDEVAALLGRGPSSQLDSMQGNRKRNVWIMEGGYTADTRYKDKLEEKLHQHDLLVRLLEDRGFEVSVLPFILGFSGTIYLDNVEQLGSIGITRPRAKALLQKLHTHAITCLQNIVTQRRRLERQVEPRHTRRYRPP